MPAIALTTAAGDYSKVEKSIAGNTLTVPIPANARVGDVLVATFASDFAGPASTTTPGWVRISTARTGTMREVSVFHAFTTDGIPAPLVLTQAGTTTAIRGTAAMYRVTGASQTERVSGTSGWPATGDSVNTRNFTIPATSPTIPGLTLAVAYNNANATQGATTGATFNGTAADTQLISYGTGGAGASSTNSAVFFSQTPGPFTVDWGKTIANSYGTAVTIPAADGGSGPATPPEVEHDDETGVAIQIGLNNFTTGAVNDPAVAPALFLAIPSRARQGDILLAAVTHSGNASVSVDSAWTLISTVRTGSNRWMSVYGYPVRVNPPYPGATFTTSEVGARMSGVMVRLTGVGFDDYKAAASEWQLTVAEDNKTAFTIPAAAKGSTSLVVAYTNVSAGQLPSQATVTGGDLVAHASKETAGQGSTNLSVWRSSGAGARTVTLSPAAANAAGFQITFQPVQAKAPAAWEARVMQNGKLTPATVAAVHQGTQFLKPSVVSWEPKDYTVDDLFSTNPFFIAHRGSGDTWPEHTMEAYNNATAYGVKALELSVQLTADNILICHHDLNFLKSAGDARTVRSMTYAQILAEIRIDSRQWTGLSSRSEGVV